MIVRPREHWLRMLFVWRGSVLRQILPQLLLMTAISLLALVTGGRIFGEKVTLNPTPFTLAGLALALFAGFRNTASYDRFWEARKLWGGVLTAARALVSQALCYVTPGVETPAAPAFDRLGFVNLTIAFAYAMKHQLRGTDPAADLARYVPAALLPTIAAAHYRPVAVLHALRGALAEQQRAGALSDTRLWMLDAQLNELGAKLAGCERIASTPIPFAYHVLLHRTVYVYCVMLPFGLVDSIGYATPFVSMFVAYTLIGLDAISGDIAEPFGQGPNHLALDALTRSIERSLLETAGEPLPDEIHVDADFRLH
jgi:ion channel-forming bestrophin family protein